MTSVYGRDATGRSTRSRKQPWRFVAHEDSDLVYERTSQRPNAENPEVYDLVVERKTVFENDAGEREEKIETIVIPKIEEKLDEEMGTDNDYVEPLTTEEKRERKEDIREAQEAANDTGADLQDFIEPDDEAGGTAVNDEEDEWTPENDGEDEEDEDEVDEDEMTDDDEDENEQVEDPETEEEEEEEILEDEGDEDTEMETEPEEGSDSPDPSYEPHPPRPEPGN